MRIRRAKIAVVAWGAMADVLYATPIVRYIRSINPRANIEWLVRDKFADVIETNPHINKVVTFKLPEGYESRQDAEYAMDQEILVYAHDNYDKVYDLQYWPRYANFFERPQEDFISLRTRNAGLLPTLIANRKIELEYSRDDDFAVRSFLLRKQLLDKKFITVNHISYAASSVWSFDNYCELVKILKKNDIKCVFTGALNEPIPDNAIDARGMPYREWGMLIAGSNLWLGLDSGAVALACAGETPIVKLHSHDFPLQKTGIKAMGLREDNVLELCPAPNPETLSQIIMSNMKDEKVR